MTDETLTLSSEAVEAVVRETAVFGRRSLETGGFLMSPLNRDHACAVALAGEKGIVRRYNLFQISERALERIFRYADESELWLPIQFHSHMFGAEMSSADRERGLCVEGFISTILPHFDEPPTDPADWNWNTFSAGRWISTSPPPTVPGEAVTIVTFDEDGVHEH